MSDSVDVIDLQVVDANHVEGCGIIVAFNDGTVAHYPPEELAELRPYRAPRDGMGESADA